MNATRSVGVDDIVSPLPHLRTQSPAPAAAPLLRDVDALDDDWKDDDADYDDAPKRLHTCRSCSQDHEPKEWIYVGTALWTRCPRCFTVAEVGKLDEDVRARVSASDSDLELEITKEPHATPALHNTLVKPAESFSRLRASLDYASRSSEA